MTNADAIREMTDNELYDFLQAFEVGDIDYSLTFCSLCKEDAQLDCDECFKRWLFADADDYNGLLKDKGINSGYKTEPSDSENPNNCETCIWSVCNYNKVPWGKEEEPKTEHSGKVTEMVEPQTEIRKDIPVICAECDHVSIHQKYLFCELSHRTVYNAKPEWCPLPKLFIADDESKTEPQIIACPLQEEDAEYARWLYEPQTDIEIARAIVHKAIDDAVIAEDAYPDLRQKMHDAVDSYKP